MNNTGVRMYENVWECVRMCENVWECVGMCENVAESSFETFPKRWNCSFFPASVAVSVTGSNNRAEAIDLGVTWPSMHAYTCAMITLYCPWSPWKRVTNRPEWPEHDAQRVVWHFWWSYQISRLDRKCKSGDERSNSPSSYSGIDWSSSWWQAII